MIRSATRKCAVVGCRIRFAQRSMTHKACSLECAAKLSASERIKQAAKSFAARKEAIKTRREWMAEAQTAFNAYIGARDVGKLCICCNKPLPTKKIGGGYDCGHYRSVGSAPHLRFNEFNAHGQTKQCNRWGAGRAVDYRIGLIARVGIEVVELLESDNEPRKYTIEELKAIKATYKAKLKEVTK